MNFADHVFSEDILSRLPFGLVESVRNTYQHHYQASAVEANQYLLGVADLLTGKSLLVHSDSALRLKAERLAGACQVNNLERAAAYLTSAGFDLPAGETDESIIARVKCPIWWERSLRRRQDKEQEHLAIQLGLVRRGLQVYVSSALLSRIQARHQRSLEILAGFDAVSDDGEVLPLLEILKGSRANPAVRRAELMVRMRGFEHYATEQGHAALFYTVTCPSKYHRYSGDQLNGKYNHSTPKEAQQYLTGLWAKIRAKLARDHLPTYGFRIAEPHHDGCPHWHLLLFMHPDHESAVTKMMRDYALQEDGDEHGAAEHRFTVERINASKGSATGYIAKYLSKNIDGFGMDADNDSGLPANDAAARVRAWASAWGIRQFQQVGGAPVGVWRELRRLESSDDELLEQARLAADSGDWCTYLKVQGGADCPRSDQPIRVYTVEAVDTDTGEVLQNRYGEFVERVKGLAVAGIRAVETRLKQWTIQARTTGEDLPGRKTLADLAPEITFNLLDSVERTFSPAGDFLQAGFASDLPWSPVNNCTDWDGWIGWEGQL